MSQRDPEGRFFRGLSLDDLRGIVDATRVQIDSGGRPPDSILTQLGRQHFRSPDAIYQIVRKTYRAACGKPVVGENSTTRMTREDLLYIYRGNLPVERTRGRVSVDAPVVAPAPTIPTTEKAAIEQFHNERLKWQHNEQTKELQAISRELRELIFVMRSAWNVTEHFDDGIESIFD